MNLFHRLELPFRLTAARIPDNARTAADDNIRMMSCQLKAL